MIPVTQTTFAPAGNCLAACLASILEVPIEAIPNFHANDDFWLNFYTYIRAQGYEVLEREPSSYYI